MKVWQYRVSALLLPTKWPWWSWHVDMAEFTLQRKLSQNIQCHTYKTQKRTKKILWMWKYVCTSDREMTVHIIEMAPIANCWCLPSFTSQLLRLIVDGVSVEEEKKKINCVVYRRRLFCHGLDKIQLATGKKLATGSDISCSFPFLWHI